jgi:hypothetical protein
MTANIKGPFTLSLSLGWKFLRRAGTLQRQKIRTLVIYYGARTHSLMEHQSSGVQIPPHPKSTLSVC